MKPEGCFKDALYAIYFWSIGVCDTDMVAEFIAVLSDKEMEYVQKIVPCFYSGKARKSLKSKLNEMAGARNGQ